MRPIPPVMLPLLGVTLLGFIAIGLTAQHPGEYGDLTHADLLRYIACALLAGVIYLAAVWLIRHRPTRPWALPFILAVGLAARLLVLGVPPMFSTDIYRYVWDGRVQAAGINPYRYIPADPALQSLRDTTPGPAAIFPNINRADTAPTIYPPAAQALFALVGLTLPSIWAIKAVMLAFDLFTTAIILLILRAANRGPADVLIWAWNPLVIWEFANAGHIDAAATAFTALALLAAIRSRAAWAGAALAVAVLIKLLPAALFPALWRRWDWRAPLAAAAVIVGSYACYSSVGWRVLGYLPGYTSEEQMQSGSGYVLLRLVRLAVPLPAWSGPAYAATALAILAALALWTVRLPYPAGPAARAEVIGRQTLILAAVLMALLSPHYPWYLTMLILPAVLTPAWSALWPTLASPLLYLDDDRGHLLWPALVFLPALALLSIDLRSRRPTLAQLAHGGP